MVYLSEVGNDRRITYHLLCPAFGARHAELSVMHKDYSVRHRTKVAAGDNYRVSKLYLADQNQNQNYQHHQSDTAGRACRQVGPISFKGKSLPPQEEMFSERISLLFKKLRVVRMVDRKRNVLVYLTYSDRLIDGSPQNSITAVPMGEVVFPRN
jgi:hypothetical protein